MKKEFKPGDIVILVESGNTIGNHVFLTPNDKSSQKSMEKLRKMRFVVVKYADHTDFYGGPCLRLRRLDTKGHGLETWSAALVQKEAGRE